MSERTPGAIPQHLSKFYDYANYQGYDPDTQMGAIILGLADTQYDIDASQLLTSTDLLKLRVGPKDTYEDVVAKVKMKLDKLDHTLVREENVQKRTDIQIQIDVWKQFLDWLES